MTDPPSPSSPSRRRSRSRFQPSSSSQRRRRSWSPRSPSSSPSGGRRSRSRSWSPAFRRPIAPLPSSSEEAPAAEEAANVLYVFDRYRMGPIGYCLYAIKLPNPILPLTENTTYPILEFPEGEYPHRMCCVELESKLYFLGGEWPSYRERAEQNWDECGLGPLRTPYPPDVYVLNTATISTNTTATTNHPSELLRKGTPMKTGKPMTYVFVAHGLIYAIGFHHGMNYKRVNLSQFEAFDPDSDKWSTLPDPPMNAGVVAHGLADRDIFVLNVENEVYSFNVDRCEWVPRAELTVRAFFGIYFDSLTAFGPTTRSMLHIESFGYFRHMGLQPSDVHKAIRDLLPKIKVDSYLVHLGNMVFYYVMVGGFPNPDPKYSTDPDKIDISIIAFEILRENHTESSSERDKIPSRAKLLHTARFVGRSKSGAIAFSRHLVSCCSISTP